MMGLKASMKILIVDDTGTMRKIIKKMLNQLGFTNITEADDGITAWPMIQEASKEGEPYEFVISDWDMPKMSGLELIKNIRADEKANKTPFLMITAEAEQSNVIIAIKAGVNNFIVKPFSADILKEKIVKIFPSK